MYIPFENLLAALILGSVSQLIVMVTKERALGQGDVRIGIIVGLIIGISNIIVWLYITVFSALVYSLYIGIKRGKFKGLKIPFVPFMILGVLIILFFF